jgi:hypothetical protein
MPAMNIVNVALPLKRFILTDHEHCPPEWKHFDLYLFRDEQVVFYVGQSQLAFVRVWNHLLGGFHGHSMIGRFMWANWPVSMKFTIELMSSLSEEFTAIGNDLSAAERQLIERWAPCFNVSLNRQPVTLPLHYRPANSRLQCGGLNKLIHQAERVVKVDDARLLIDE